MYHGKANPGFSILGDSISTLKGYVPDDWRIHYEGEVHVDGITEPAHTWWGQIIDHFDGHLVSNSSFSGSTVEGFGFPAGCSQKRIESLLGPDGEVPDVVLIFMGINDYGWGGGRNQVMGGSISASAKPDDLPGEKNVIGVVGPEALDLFADAYSRILEGIAKIAPDADVWCLNLAPGTVPGADWPNFMYRIRGIEMDDYNAAIAKAAEAAGAHVVDVRGFDICLDSVDGVHPSALGMRQLAAMAVSQMEGAPTQECADLLAKSPKPQRECFEPNCDGCEFSDIQKHRWSLYCSKFGAMPA